MNPIMLIISVILITTILIVYTYLLCRLWNRCDKLKNTILEIQKQVNDGSALPKQSGQKSQQQSVKSTLDDKEIDTIADIVVPRVLECVRLDLNERANRLDVVNNGKINPGIKFFRTKQGKNLQDDLPSNSGASFKVDINKATFEYCGGVVNINYFDEICVFENNPADVPNKKDIITTVPGTVKKDSNDNWVIDKPAKIKFI